MEGFGRKAINEVMLVSRHAVLHLCRNEGGREGIEWRSQLLHHRCLCHLQPRASALFEPACRLTSYSCSIKLGVIFLCDHTFLLFVFMPHISNVFSAWTTERVSLIFWLY